MEDYQAALEARDRAGRVVLVGENDHYKPLAVRLRRLLADGVIGEMVFAHFTTIARRLKTADDWRNDEAMAGGDAFFEEGHPLAAPAAQPRPGDHDDSRLSARGVARRARSARQEHDGGVPLRQRRGRVALLLARDSVALPGTAAVEAVRPPGRHHVRIERRVRAGAGRGLPARDFPGVRDIRGYQAMYRDFHRAIRDGARPR